MYKVFINNKPLFFIENDENISKLDSQFVFNCNNQEDKKRILEAHTTNNIEIYVGGNDFETTWQLFFSDFKIVEAAGGIVLNQRNEILFILRNGFWDLPKGKVEKEESVDVAAIREVEEECGIKKPSIIKKLLVTYHTYDTYGENCIKPTHWYLMRYEGDEKLFPQEEEGITKVEWVKREDISSKLSNTFGSIVDVIKVFQGLQQ